MSVTPQLPGKAIKGVYRGYMPVDLPQHRPRNRIKPWWKVEGRPRVSLYPRKEIEGFSEVAEYPSLNDGSKKGLLSQVRYDWYDTLKKIPTVDGKMHEINKHSNHFLAQTRNWIGTYNPTPLVQYMTNTRLINDLPESYQINQETDQNKCNGSQLIDEVERIVLDQVALDKYQSKKREPMFLSKTVTIQLSRTRVHDQIVQNIVNNVKRCLARQANPQLLTYQSDLNPAIRSWWYHSGFPPPSNKIFYRSRKDEDGYVNTMIQMDGSCAMTMRTDSFMKPIVSLDDPMANEPDVIKSYGHQLRRFGFTYKFNNPVSLTGQWYTENQKHDFPHTCFLNTDCLRLRDIKDYKIVRGEKDNEECLTAQAMLTAFGWANSMANYHGFTNFHEIEYPFTFQVISTDGQNWMFNVYQMNSHTFHRDFGKLKRNNICWSSGLMQLYKNFNSNKGEFEEINQDVIRLLVRFLSQKTDIDYTKSLNLRPYLGEENRDQTQIETERVALRRTIEQRKNKWLLHDWKVPLWEKIFFSWKPARYSIKQMKPRWHIPKTKYPRIFE